MRCIKAILTSVHSMNPEARRHSICLLCRILVDKGIAQNACTVVRVEETLEMLVSSMPDDTAEQEVRCSRFVQAVRKC